MVGNSPKSDINPALAAGLNAVFVPHGNTWVLEHEDLAPAELPSRLLVVEKFAALAEHFEMHQHSAAFSPGGLLQGRTSSSGPTCWVLTADRWVSAPN